jgi:hypothetical protein
VHTRAIGIALIQLLIGDKWECFEVPNVVVLDKCASVLYSTRVMRDLFGFTHDLDGGLIKVPGAQSISITDDSAAFYIPVIFTPRSAPRPREVHTPKHVIPVIALAGAGETVTDSARIQSSSSSIPQAIVYHRLAFPYREQWSLVPCVELTNSAEMPKSTMTELVSALQYSACSNSPQCPVWRGARGSLSLHEDDFRIRSRIFIYTLYFWDPVRPGFEPTTSAATRC